MRTQVQNIPGVYSSSSSFSTSPIDSTDSSRMATALVLRDRVDILVLLFADPPPGTASSAFLLGGVVAAAAGRRASSSMAGLAWTNDSQTSRMARLCRSFDSWSVVRHKGHLPSVFKALRMQSEQKVWEQDVIMGELKKSLQT